MFSTHWPAGKVHIPEDRDQAQLSHYWQEILNYARTAEWPAATNNSNGFMVIRQRGAQPHPQVISVCCTSMTSARKGRGAGAACNCVETASRSQPTQLADACMLASGKTSNSRLMFTRNAKPLQKIAAFPASRFRGRRGIPPVVRWSI